MKHRARSSSRAPSFRSGIGNSVGLILPKELLARLKLQVGDQLHVVDHTERSLKRSPYDPKHAKAMEIAGKAFRDYADSFEALAK
jgi:putative addiction module antidote